MKKTLMLVLALSGFAGAMTETVVISDFTWTTGVNTTYAEDTLTYTGAKNTWSLYRSAATLSDTITLNTDERLTLEFDVKHTNGNHVFTMALEGTDTAIVIGHGTYSSNSDLQLGLSESLTSGIGASNGYTFANTDSPAPGIKQIVPTGSVASGMPDNTVNTITLNIAWDQEAQQFAAIASSSASQDTTKMLLGSSVTVQGLAVTFDGNTKTTVSNISLTHTPEPATATLSLLALAALASRRKRH